MEDPSPIDGLRAAMAGALRAHDELLAAWRRVEPAARSALNAPADVEMLRELIVRRIYTLDAFDALARVDRTAAVGVLLSRYLGRGVDPDRKFGGYSFELDGMLDDLREAGGELALRALVGDPRFARELLADPRVAEAFAAALDIPPDQVCVWAKQGQTCEPTAAPRPPPSAPATGGAE